MMLSLHVRHIALIEDLTLEFAKGLHVLTGETGAGKSLVVDALNLVLGGRAERDLIMVGREKASVELVLDLGQAPELGAFAAEQGFETEDGLLFVSRELSSSGRNICRVGGVMVPLAVLRGITRRFVDVHGQHEHQSLLDDKQHLDLLDAYGAHSTLSKALLKAKDEVKNAYDAFSQTRKKLQSAQMDEAQRERQLDLLNHQIDEIGDAKLQIGEEEKLLTRREKFRHAGKISSALDAGYALLYDGKRAALDAVKRSWDEMEDIAALDERYKALCERLAEAFYILEDAAIELRDMREAQDFDPAQVDVVEARLDTIHRLEKRYGPTIEEILSFYENAMRERDELEDNEALRASLEKKLEKEKVALEKASAALSEIRLELSGKLGDEVSAQLGELGMPHARMQVALEKSQRFSALGMDEACFLISTNPGQPAKPLGKVASGGELSRIMLALKNIFAELDGIPSMVFDEIDTGISGRMAQVVAEKMATIAASRQVICVTHLPQIAAMADTHFLVEKHAEADKTHTTVKALCKDERVQELARMIGGASLGKSEEAHAAHLLESAENWKAENGVSKAT